MELMSEIEILKELMSETEIRGIAGGGVQSLMDAGEFPAPVEHGPAGRRWDRTAVEEWCAARVADTAQQPQTRERQEPGRETRPVE